MSSNVNEIVTLQIGHYANFVGTHWWNLQESSFTYNPSEANPEISHDVLYREGQNLMGEVTYTPRLVTFDLKGSLNTLRQDGTLYDLIGVDDDIHWQNDLTLHKIDPLPKNEFLKDLESDKVNEEQIDDDKEECDTSEQSASTSSDTGSIYRTKLYDLDRSVNVWSDFLRVHLHPKSVHVIEEFRHDGEAQFDVFCYGETVYKDSQNRSVIEDKLHFFLEECDYVQGLQILVDPYNGFGGIAAGLLEDLVDDYGNKALFSLPVTPPAPAKSMIKDDCYRLLNSVLTYDRLLGDSSAVLPISLATHPSHRSPLRPFPYLQYNSELAYHTAAVLGASLDTMSLPYRVNSASVSLTDMLNALTPAGQKLLCLHSTLPYPMFPKQSLVSSLLGAGDTLPWQPLTPICSINTAPYAQSVVMRGVQTSRLKGAHSEDLPKLLQNCSSISDLLNLYLTEATQCRQNAICSVQSSLKLESPFPHIFQPTVSCTGEIADKPRPNTTGVTELATLTSLQSTSECGLLLDQMLREVRKYNIKKFHKFQQSGLEDDDYKEVLNRLESVRELYSPQDIDMS